MDKDNFFTGLVVGAITPVLGFLLVEFIFDLLTQAGLMEFVSSGGSSKRQRTLALLGICATLIPMHICKNNKWNETMRGMIFPIMLYMGAWIYYFKDSLFTF